MAEGKGGLEGVIACTTEICAIDGQRGRLIYRGYDVTDLVGRVSFEEVAWLLWTGTLPTAAELADLRLALAEAGRLPEGVVALLSSLPRTTGMAALRTACSALGQFEPESGVGDADANRRKAIRLTGQVPAIVTAWWRLGRGLPVLTPLADLGPAANFLYMLEGERPGALQARAMDAALVLHADHELNASTFAARVTAATLADMHAAVTSAVGALEGPLHGGANEAAMSAVLEIGAPERAAAWVGAKLAAGEKIPGFGHRVYRTTDPRAAVLRDLARQLAEAGGDLQAFGVTAALEQAMGQQRGLYPNVDLYSGDVYRALGIDSALFTPVFACSRISGWTAHIMEQYRHNRLIRPRAQYVGPTARPLAAAGR